MPYTTNCDFYLAIHENGINSITKRAMKYLPSFFNYTDEVTLASNWIGQSFNPNVACIAINPDPSVLQNGYPVVSTIKLPTNLQLPLNLHLPAPLNFVAQLSGLGIDFNPSNAVTLPTSVPSPLSSQTMALSAQFAVGLSCPSTGEMECFSLNPVVEMMLKKQGSAQFLNTNITAMDIVGLEPDGLRKILDCYIPFFANQVLGTISTQLSNTIAGSWSLPAQGLTNLRLSPANVANNPAIQNDQLELFMNLASISINEVVGVSGVSQPGSSYAPPVSKATRTRPGSGPSDLTTAISSSAISRIFSALLNKGPSNPGISIQAPARPAGGWPAPPPPQGMGVYGSPPIYFYYQVGASLSNGSISLQNDGTIHITDLTVSWDTFKIVVNIDLPQVSIPFDGTLFGGNGHNPDISFTVDLGGLFQSLVSIVLKPAMFYATGNPNQTNNPNRWQLYVAPQLPIFAIPVELNTQLVNKIKSGIQSALGGLSTAEQVALAAALLLFGGPLGAALLAAYIAIMTDPGQLAEQIVDMIVNANALGLTTIMDNALYDYFTNQAPLFELRDPLIGPTATSQNWGVNPMGPGVSSNANPIGPSVISLPIPIAYLGLTVNSSEMVIEGDIGP